jgi:hypothetical protein
MKRLVFGAVAALLLLTVAIATVEAKGPPAGAGRSRGIGEAATHTSGPEATKITFTDLIVSGYGKPIDDGGD